MTYRRGDSSGDFDKVMELAFDQAEAVIRQVQASFGKPLPSPEKMREQFREIMDTLDPAEWQGGRDDWIERFGQEDWDRHMGRRLDEEIEDEEVV